MTTFKKKLYKSITLSDMKKTLKPLLKLWYWHLNRQTRGIKQSPKIDPRTNENCIINKDGVSNC